MPPHFEIMRRKRDGFLVRHTENGHIGDPVEPAAEKDGIGQGGIVISRQDHDRERGVCEQLSRLSQDSGVELIILEGIAREQNDIRP